MIFVSEGRYKLRRFENHRPKIVYVWTLNISFNISGLLSLLKLQQYCDTIIGKDDIFKKFLYDRLFVVSRIAVHGNEMKTIVHISTLIYTDLRIILSLPISV